MWEMKFSLKAGREKGSAAFALAAALLALSPPALAQDQPAYITADRARLRQAFGEQVANRVFSNQYTARRQAVLAESARRIPGFDCPAQPPAQLITVFPWPAVPGRSAWIERYALRCQPATVRNFMVVEDGGEARFAEMAPGLSNTDPQLQRDLMPGIIGAAQRLKPAGCTAQPIVTDVRIIREELPTPGKWREVWQISQCGQRGELRVAFTPSAGRGTNWAIERTP